MKFKTKQTNRSGDQSDEPDHQTHRRDASTKRLSLGVALVIVALVLGGCVERDVYACKVEAEKAYPDPYCAEYPCFTNRTWLTSVRKGVVSTCMAGKGWRQKYKCTFFSDDPDCFEPD
jgi:hypothetical protein